MDPEGLLGLSGCRLRQLRRIVNAKFKCRTASQIEMSHFFFLDEPGERRDCLAFEPAQAFQPEANTVVFLGARQTALTASSRSCDVNCLERLVPGKALVE